MAPLEGPRGCCFRWEITRGPHERMVFTHCVHREANATQVLKVGRQKLCWMRLRMDLEVSSVHAEFRLQSDGAGSPAANAGEDQAETMQAFLCDLKSTNGTRINGEPLIPHQEYPLADQDLIHFGKTVVRFRVVDSNKSEAAAQVDGAGGSDQAGAEGQAQMPGPEQVLRVTEVSLDQESRLESEKPSQSTRVPEEEDFAKTDASHHPLDPQTATTVDGFAMDEDADLFEDSSTMNHVVPPPTQTSLASSGAASTSSMTCMICSRWLGHFDVLEQQLHINACLDGRTQRAENWLPQPPATARNASNLNNQTKKRKRKREAATAEDDEVAMALAISKSIANKEQVVDMDIALLSGELAQIDAQMAKLAKKREALLKRMVKLEKAKAKVKRSTVLQPSETRVLLDLSKVLRSLFPQKRILTSREGDERHRSFMAEQKKVRAIPERYTPQIKRCLYSDNSEPLPSMWTRASQQLWGHIEKDLYRNSILLPFVGLDGDSAAEMGEPDASAGNNDKGEAQIIEPHDESGIPDVVKRVFPDWAENLAFLRQQCLEDLEGGLQEMARQRQDRHNEEPESEDEVCIVGQGSSKAEEDQACAFFENVIRDLIKTKQCALSERRDSAAKEVIDVDSDDAIGSSNSHEMRESIISIDDTSDEELEVSGVSPLGSRQGAGYSAASRSSAVMVNGDDESDLIGVSRPHVVNKMLTGTNASRLESISNDSQGEIPAPESSLATSTFRRSVVAEASEIASESTLANCGVEENATTSQPRATPQVDTTASQTCGGGMEDMETQLLRVLKAHPTFYETMLLLRPLDVNEFFKHVTQEANIKCTKKYVYEFFDRHGITFKQH